MDMSADPRNRLPPNASANEVSSSQQQLDQFCAFVLDDVALQEKLRDSDDFQGFAALVVDTARRCGFSFTAEDVSAAMRERALDLMGVPDRRVRETTLPPAGWLPIRASWQDGEPCVQWSWFGGKRLTEPFFEGSVQRALFKPFNRLFRHVTPIGRLGEWLRDHPPLRPSGFIFHMSRCGSTLVSQMLAALAHNVVISEANPLDAVVRTRHARPDLSEDLHALWLASMIGALGQPRGGDERHFFIKLDSWHTLELPLFRRAFPSVPWVFLYRDPVEVLVSQATMPGAQMVLGVIGPGLSGIGSAPHRPEDYYAQVLAKICEPVLQHVTEGGGLLVNYRDLPAALWTTIMPHFGVPVNDCDRAAMAEAARFDAKMPRSPFAADADAKQQAATEPIRIAADQWLGELYRRLEAARRGEP
jgi:Nif11 domain